MGSLLDELSWRGLIYQQTEGLAAALAAAPVSGYVGFDPTAPSLHVGNLVPVMGLVHLQRSGHNPIILVGGGTGLIGDPSGKTTERQLGSADTVAANARAIRTQLERFVDFTGPRAARMLDNAEWLTGLRAIDFMRETGRHFTISSMLAKESVKSRLEGSGGISYTEFSYMLLQAYDYLELSRRAGARLQLGGSDQWGNITAGIELIRRVDGGEAHALTFPLMTTAAGTKFGKTEAGSVWLDPERTSPYRFYQFWINAEDRDVPRFLRTFTLLDRSEIEELERTIAERPERREAQQRLAVDITSRVHGEDPARVAAEVSDTLFGGADPASLSLAALEALRREVPFAEVTAPGSGEAANEGFDVMDMMITTGLAASRGAGRRLLEQGGVYVNGRRLAADERRLSRSHLLPGRHFLLRKGARDYALVHVAE
ncbi:MAG: tyrosine--tRNA ligase [Gemmatimonadaceae bacterium]